MLLLLLLSQAGTPLDRTTGFEGLPSGPVVPFETPVGAWSADPDHARIDDKHHRGGTQCLHVLGGDAREVVLDLANAGQEVDRVRLWCERWTQRDPFRFRIDARVGADWQEIYRGDEEVTIGTFRTRVEAPIPPRAGALRFRCTSPSGVLIDDVSLVRDAPMTVAAVRTTQRSIPCLLRGRANDVAVVEIVTGGNLAPHTLEELRVNLDGTTDLADLAYVEVVGPSGERFGRRHSPAKELVFRGAAALAEGVNPFRIQLTLAETANIDHVVDVGCDAVRLAGQERTTPAPRNPPGTQRLGIALRRAGDDGSAAHRIPGITTTNKGTLIAVYDVRWKGFRDLPGDIDVGMSRSTDGGRTWEPMRVIMDMGSDPAFQHDGIGDPAILYDRVQGTLWVAATWSHGNRAWRGSSPGLTPDETGQTMLVRSDDDGKTWSKPINITAQVKRPEWCYLLPGPGRGICMQDGTLVFAAQFQDTEANGRVPWSTLLYSKDRGATWALGRGARRNTTEAQVVELEPGTLMLNMRDNRGGLRAVSITKDLGATWTEHATSRRSLVEPVCNAALLRFGDEGLLFCNPAVASPPRRRMTLRASPDFGTTWPEGNQLLLDQGSSAGYPSMTMIGQDNVGLFFEGSNAQLTFMRVPLADVAR